MAEALAKWLIELKLQKSMKVLSLEGKYLPEGKNRPAEKRYATNFSSNNSKNQLKLMPEVYETSNYVKSHVVFLLKIAIGMRHDFKNLNFTDFMLLFHPK